jgi:hypothetical protein
MLPAALILSLAGPALAGGWAVTTFDELPGEFQAGEEYRLGYTILQHGETPVPGADTWIAARNPATGDVMKFPGAAEGVAGHYVATVTFPTGGQWVWSVWQGDFGEHALGDLTVASAPATAAPVRLPTWGLVLAVATAAALGMFIVQVVGLSRRRSSKLGIAD